MSFLMMVATLNPRFGTMEPKYYEY